MEVECNIYGRASTDKTVRYWKTDPKCYLAHKIEECSTPGCTGHERYLVPVDKGIPWRKGMTETLDVKRINGKQTSRSTAGHLLAIFRRVTGTLSEVQWLKH